jgi:hypothetical protein
VANVKSSPRINSLENFGYDFVSKTHGRMGHWFDLPTSNAFDQKGLSSSGFSNN